MSGQYNTPLTPGEALDYQHWIALQSAIQGRDVGADMRDYDMQGAFKSGAATAPNGHFPDTFKKPNHPSFSDQSQYHGVDGHQGGSWVQMGGRWTFTPGATNLQLHGPDSLQQYFQRADPNVWLNLPRAQPVSMQDYVGQKLAQLAPDWRPTPGQMFDVTPRYQEADPGTFFTTRIEPVSVSGEPRVPRQYTSGTGAADVIQAAIDARKARGR